jgi:hypothetical protein
VNVDQFFGIEIEEFPAQIAQVALWLTDHQMNQRVSEEFGHYFARLPLITSPTIVHGNALRLDWETVVPKERITYILGNPPFIGHHLQTPEQKADMLAAIGVAEAAGVLDYVCAWYSLAVKFIQGTEIRCAFVSTNSITQGEQVGILWRALLARNKAFLHFAHRTFRWSNEGKGQAAVYCVIIGFAVRESRQRLLFDYDHPDSEPHVLAVSEINAYLVEAPWLLLENRSTNLCGMPEMMYGSKPTDDGHFFFSDDEKTAFLSRNPEARPLIKRFMGAREYIHDERRWVLWLAGVDPRILRDLPEVMARVKAVEAFRKASKAESTKSYPHPTLFRQITQPKSDYILIPGHTSENRRYIPFGFLSKDVIVGNSCFSIPGATYFHFGVIQSAMHMAWVRSTCGRLKSDFRYSKDIVYNNFIWPEAPSEKQSMAIAEAAQEVLAARKEFPGSSLADLYDPLTMPTALVKAHHRLDKVVDAAYGHKGARTDTERVAFLFGLYEKYTSLFPVVTSRPKRQLAAKVPPRVY